MTTARLGDIATLIRSKNAGPYRYTLDIVFADDDTYRAVVSSGVITPRAVADLYGVPIDAVTTVRTFDAARAIKVTLRRAVPSGSPGDGDVYGAQQHAPLLTLEVPMR